MSMFGKHSLTVVAVLSCLVLTPFRASAAPMPEFANSVQFDKSGPELKMSQLRGKAVLVVFFQSWCGICNGWGPKMIQQVQQAHGDNHSLVMVAIKTDGGGVAGARDYLKAAGADLTKWAVASDNRGAFHQQVTGKDELWQYVLVGANGDIVKQGKSGDFWTNGPEKDKYVLASSKLLEPCGKLEPLLPPDKKYPPELSRIVRLAESGCVGKALSQCTTPAQKDLKQELLNIIETRFKQHMDILKDPNKDWGSRYESYMELGLLVGECPAAPAAKEATAMLAKANSAPLIQKEKSAQTAYLYTTLKLQNANKQDRPRLLKELELVASKYEGTKYGRLAGVESQAARQ